MDHTTAPHGCTATLILLSLLGCAGISAENTSEGSGTATGGSPSKGGTTVNNESQQKGGASSTQSKAATGGVSRTDVSQSDGGTASKSDPKSTLGTTANGGETATGGAQSSKDTAATGGRTSTRRTKAPSGGASAGGAVSAGGTRAAGGDDATGAKPTSDTSVSSAGSSSTDAQSSSGCGKADFAAACSTKGTPCSIDVGGKARTYYVYLPDKYDASQPYPLVFQFHPMGGTAEQAISIPSIRSKFAAIYVTPQGLTSGSSTGWPNTNGQDMDFTKAMLNTVQESYCVDKSRIFSTGFSYGGMMSFAIGCEMGDVFRAIAPMSGAQYSGCKNGTHPVAMWGSHGVSDNVVPIADGRTARDAILKRNNCGTETVATTPSPCVSYQGCESGYPTTWCEFEGSHAPPSFAAAAIVDFFKQF